MPLLNERGWTFQLHLKMLLLVFGSLLTSVLGGTLRGPLDGYEVTQIHIAQGTNPTAMTISWVTKADAATEVQFGELKDLLDRKVDGFSSSYKFDYPNYGVYESGTLHHAYITNLAPDTIYYYKCGDFSTGQTSGTQFFRTLPRVGDTRPFTFGVVGDLGQTNDSMTTLSHMVSNKDIAMILHAGDLSYADCNQPLWDSYGNLVEVLARERWIIGLFFCV